MNNPSLSRCWGKPTQCNAITDMSLHLYTVMLTVDWWRLCKIQQAMGHWGSTSNLSRSDTSYELKANLFNLCQTFLLCNRFSTPTQFLHFVSIIEEKALVSFIINHIYIAGSLHKTLPSPWYSLEHWEHPLHHPHSLWWALQGCHRSWVLLQNHWLLQHSERFLHVPHFHLQEKCLAQNKAFLVPQAKNAITWPGHGHFQLQEILQKILQKVLQVYHHVCRSQSTWVMTRKLGLSCATLRTAQLNDLPW